MKTIIERGASWGLDETKMLLALWGQDLVQRQATNTKRTKEVYEKISEKFNQHGFERTADQVRTRVFNMIAEYRRILKDPNPERQKKCVFFEALHKIYQAKHMDDVKSALDDYEPEYPYSPASNTISSERGDESVSDGEATDGNETINNNLTTNNNNSNAATISTLSAQASATTATSTSHSSNNLINTTTIDNNIGETPLTVGGFLATGEQKELSMNSLFSTNSNAAGGATKKVKLDSPKSGQNQSSVPSTSSTSTTASSSTDHQNNSTKQSKTSSSSSSTTATTTLNTATINTGTATSSSSATTSQRHQSLLLPHGTTSGATSTPISKITTTGSNNTPSYININSTKLPIIRTNQLIGHSNGNESLNLNGTTTRLPTTAAITSHQLYQAPVNTFDVTSSALLIDRMFAHLSRESENMREWIALEKERLALERTRRQQEADREARRERVLIETLMKFQEQWLTFLSRLDMRNSLEHLDSPPQLIIPKEAYASAETSQTTQPNSANQNSHSSSAVNNSGSSSNQATDASKQ